MSGDSEDRKVYVYKNEQEGRVVKHKNKMWKKMYEKVDRLYGRNQGKRGLKVY